jgi:hypothetical protein
MRERTPLCAPEVEFSSNGNLCRPRISACRPCEFQGHVPAAQPLQCAWNPSVNNVIQSDRAYSRLTSPVNRQNQARASAKREKRRASFTFFQTQWLFSCGGLDISLQTDLSKGKDADGLPIWVSECKGLRDCNVVVRVAVIKPLAVIYISIFSQKYAFPSALRCALFGYTLDPVRTRYRY